jgi:lipid-A-disaccharide synthase
MTTAKALRVGIVAGESSGDQLGAALITALRARVPNLECFGMAGPKMVAAGCEAWASSEELSTMGLFEVLRLLPRLLRLRSSLAQRFEQARPDVFVGIDVPDFNLGLEKRLKRAGLKTVQYVSPQVWAWRQGRVRTIARSCDLILCLFPFETEFYAQHGVRAEFVGHPLADQIPLEVDRAGARARLGIPAGATIVALLPGSRLGEVERLGADFVRAAQWIQSHRRGVQFIAPMASARVRAAFERALSKAATVPSGVSAAAVRGAAAPLVRLVDGQAQTVLAAADAVIVASGTATLETLLSGRPMVAAYRVGALTAFLLRGLALVKVPHFSQPNLLIGRRLVPEFLQEQVNGPALGAALLEQLDAANGPLGSELQREFRRVHELLRQGGADRAAAAILGYART